MLFINKMVNVIVFSNIHDKFVTTNQTCNLKILIKKHKNSHYTCFERKIHIVEDVCPLPGPGQKHLSPPPPPLPHMERLQKLFPW